MFPFRYNTPGVTYTLLQSFSFISEKEQNTDIIAERLLLSVLTFFCDM